MSDGRGAGCGVRNAHDRPPLLSIEHLTTGFEIHGRFVPAVNDVSFCIDAGKTLCLVGESGSGKTLAALSLIKLVPPAARIASGALWLDGRNVMELGEREMQHVRGGEVGFVFQEPMTALNPVFTIGSQIAETLRIHKLATRQTARARAIELLAAVSVPEPHRRIDDYPHQLSGGLRQRALIALALAGEPKLLIADEPTTALDVTIQAQILELLRDLQRRLGLGLLLITHDLGVVAGMADDVAIMYAGRIVEYAPVKAMFADPRHPYTRGLLASVPDAAPGTPLRGIPGSVPALDALPPGCSFSTRCPERFGPCTNASPEDTFFAAEHRSVKCHLYGHSQSTEMPR
jgi:peptide/nickel transport system ATP-binding protein